MTDPETFLKNLGRLARSTAETEAPTGIPFGLTTRTIARLREVQAGNPWILLAGRFVPIGGVVTALILAFAWFQPVTAADDVSANLADEIVLTALNP